MVERFVIVAKVEINHGYGIREEYPESDPLPDYPSLNQIDEFAYELSTQQGYKFKYAKVEKRYYKE